MDFENNQNNIDDGLEDVQDQLDKETPEEEENLENNDEGNSEENNSEEDNSDADDESDNDDESQSDEFSFDYAFDDEIVTVNDREEAASLMQQGRLYRESENIIQAVGLISARTGISPVEVVNNLLDALNKNELDRCIEECDGDTFKGTQMYQQQLSNAQKEYDEARAKRTGAGVKQRTEERLAAEFVKFKDELPYDKVSDIPAGVIELCVKENQSLLAAELMYRHFEDKKIKANNAQKNKNQKSSPGNIAGRGDDGNDFSRHSDALLKA